MEVFDISVADVGGTPVISVSGEIDVATSPRLRDQVATQCQEGSTVVVDLLEVTFLDSTGLGVLVAALRRCREAGGDLRLTLARPRILKLFEIAGLTDVFSIHDTVAGACASSR